MTKQLSQQEIDKLFDFVKSKYVRFIDVQYEIVDHLASAIEEKQEEDPSLSFNRALTEVYSKFPITGFNLIIDAKQSALTKFWLKKFIGFMFSYLKLPKILISGFIGYIIFLIFQNGTQLSINLLVIGCFLFLLGCLIYRYRTGFEFNKEFRDKYLIINTYLSWYAGYWLFYSYIPINILLDDFNNVSVLDFSTLQSGLAAFYMTTVILWIHAFHFEFPKMLKQELEEKYRHLNIKLA